MGIARSEVYFVFGPPTPRVVASSSPCGAKIDVAHPHLKLPILGCCSELGANTVNSETSLKEPTWDRKQPRFPDPLLNAQKMIG